MTRNFVEKKLLEIGVPAGMQGFVYIADAMMLIDKEKKEFFPRGKMAWLYSMIGKKNLTSGSSVERSIRFAFETVRKEESRHEIVEHYIGFEQTHNKHSLFMLYTVLKNEFVESVPQSSDQCQIKEFIVNLAEQYGLKISVLN